jgi:hypothetical protein
MDLYLFRKNIEIIIAFRIDGFTDYSVFFYDSFQDYYNTWLMEEHLFTNM